MTGSASWLPLSRFPLSLVERERSRESQRVRNWPCEARHALSTRLQIYDLKIDYSTNNQPRIYQGGEE